MIVCKSDFDRQIVPMIAPMPLIWSKRDSRIGRSNTSGENSISSA